MDGWRILFGCREALEHERSFQMVNSDVLKDGQWRSSDGGLGWEIGRSWHLPFRWSEPPLTLVLVSGWNPSGLLALLVSVTRKDLLGGLWSCQQPWLLSHIIYSLCLGFCYREGQANWVFLALRVGQKLPAKTSLPAFQSPWCQGLRRRRIYEAHARWEPPLVMVPPNARIPGQRLQRLLKSLLI